MKKLNVLLGVILIGVFVSACATQNKVNIAETTETVEEVKKFVVGFDAEYPPYGYLGEDGKSYEGFDLDLAREFCKRKGYEFVAQPIDWDSKDLELNSGNIDCIWNGFTVTGRENDYTWTFPYVDNSIVIVVRSDSGINTKSDLSGKAVMVQAGSSGLAALGSEENKEFVSTLKKVEQCPDYNTAFMNLESGVVDAVCVDIGVAKYKLKSEDGKYAMLDENVSTEQYAVGFKKGNKELRDEVEKCLSDMWKDGTFSRIANKYVSYSLTDMICIGDYVE